MLGSALGTDLLNGWVNAINDGVTRGAIATIIGAEARSTSALAMDRSYISVPTATPTR